MVGKRKLGIFDLDGTLIHYEHEHFFRETLRILPELGYPNVTIEDLRKYFSNFDYFGFVPKAEQQKFEEKFWDAASREHFPSPREIQGAIDTLAHLVERDMKIAIATARSTIPEKLASELRGTGIHKYVNFISTKRGDKSAWYDKTEQLKRICRHLNTSPADSLMVGDIPPDIWSAKNAGIGRTIAVLSGGILEDLLQKEDPDHLVTDVSEIPELVRRSIEQKDKK